MMLRSSSPKRDWHPIASARRPVWIPVALLLALLVSRPSWSAEPAPAQLGQIGVGMQKFVDQGVVSGVVAVVGRHDRVLGATAVGLRDIDSKQPMAADTMFRIASMTKPVTSIAVMMLVDEGKLSIDDEVEKHLPEFRGQMLVASRTPEILTLKKPSRKITVRDLLTHTSGLPGFPPGLSDIYVKRNHTLAEVIMALSQRPLEFEPGSKWAYCNSGMDTLGRVVEVVSGKPYEAFLQERIFQPLGMNDTTFYPDEKQRQRVATVFDTKQGKLTAVFGKIIGPPEGARYPVPAGGLYSTGADLARLYQMMLNRGQHNGRQLLSEASVRAMTTDQLGALTAGFVPGMGFGLGWGLVRQSSGVTEVLSPGSYGHGGAFGTQGWIDPKQDLFVVLLIQRVGLPNADNSDLRRELQKLAVAAVKASR